ncbi:peptidoglycan DD-metalloendopeptidase family protein [Streptomyces sp. SID8352]|uniref:peptidoglycan DD-metalloendopeptidase family protein n=1 Tax=Streptomyces sp. SID8352 TaxID=2690338 RepID=UPI00136D02EF|nr:peptidoglycan DD-metalloendopeptidase family protein [Streptomyces sp. SID8352]MYU24637.1 peptidoglycan DD-metalloendopeptidase family protein [Streptomyces sp. SID8352]
MAEATVVGRTRVSLTPDTSNFGSLLRVELPKAIRPGAIRAGDLAGQIITGKVRTAVSKMKPVVKVGISLDTAAAKTELGKLTARRTATITAQADTATAKQELGRLTTARTVKVTAQLDDRGAKSALGRLTADRTVKVTAGLDDRAARDGLTRLTASQTVKVTVGLDETAAKAKLRGILGQRTVDVLPRIQQAAYRAAERQLDKLTADRVVNIRASVDTRVGAQEIRNLTQRRQVRIGIDVDTRVAADSLANLTRRRQMTVQARADTAAANTALTFLTRDRTMNVRVRTTGLAALTGSLGRLSSSGGGVAGGMLSTSGRITALTTAALSALPAIASLSSALAQMGPLAATAAPALGLLIGSFTAIKLGTKGVGDALKAAFEDTSSEAKAAASATRQVETAQRSLTRAQRSLQDARVSATERVRQAQEAVTTSERALIRSQRDAQRAQLDLTAARRQAARDLQDLNQRLKAGRLSEAEATLAIQQAELDLQATRSDPAATQLQIQQAELARDRAVQSLEDQRIELARLEKDTAAANKAGVEGSKTVVDAKRQVAAADEQVAERGRAVAAAQQQVTKAQVEGQREIADAQEAVADAVRAVADAQQNAAAQTTKLDEALAKLSPNARGFVRTIQSMAPAWSAMRLDVQDSLFAGLGARLKEVGSQVLPTVRTGLAGAAGDLNLMGRNALGAVASLEKTGVLAGVFDGIRSSLGNLARLPGQLVTAFGQLSVAARPAFDRMTGGLAESMDRAMAKMGKAFEDGRLEKAISTALDVAVQFGGVLGDLGGIIGGIMKAADAAGGDFFGVIGAALKEIRRVIELPEMQEALTAVFRALNAVASLLAGALGAALQAFLPVLAALAPVVVQLAEKLGPVLAQIFTELATALMPVIEALMPVIVDVVTVIADLAVQLLPLLAPLGTLIGAIVTAVSPIISMIGQNLTTLIMPLVQALVPVILGLLPAVGAIGQILGQLAPLFPPLLQALMPLLPPLGELAVSLLTLALQVITPLMPLIVGLAGLFTGVLAGAVGFLVSIISTVIGWFTAFTDACTAAVKWVVDRFRWLWDVLLGHSIIPDIVNGTVGWFKRLWRWLKELIGGIVSGTVGFFRDLKNDTIAIWDAFWRRVKSIASDAWGLVREGFDRFAGGLKKAFEGMRDGIGDIWSGIKNLVAAPIRFWIDTVYNNGIVSVWNATAAKLPGVPDLQKMSMPKGLGKARGGILPGWSTWRDGDDQLVPMRRGEGVYVSEVMRDPYERARLHALNAAAIRGTHPAIARSQYGFAEGGILGGLKAAGSGIVSGVGKVLDKGADVARGGLANLAEKAFSPIKKGIRSVLGADTGGWKGMIASAPLNLIDKAIDWIRGKDIPEPSGAWRKPVTAPFGTPFGQPGLMWASGKHTGLDFPAKTGTKVVAVDNGTVRAVENGGPYGKHITIDHGGGLASLYAHLSSMVAKAGDGIKQGARVGAVGATGNVTGPHLHLEARLRGKGIDPMPYLSGGDAGGSGVQRWTGVVQQALGELRQSMGLVSTTLRRMSQESGGDPRSVNRWDSNWKAGHPSVGLMQVIKGTFAAYAGKYRKTGPFMYGVSVDPMANIYASMRYALDRYGSLPKAYNRPGGYARGGVVSISRGLPRGYAKGGTITVGGKRIDTGPIAASVGVDFLKQLAGTAAQIDAAMTKVATAIKTAFKGVNTTLDDKLLKQISTQTKKLDALAKQRDAIAAKITAARQLAADATDQAVSFTSMTGLPNSGLTFGAGGILAGLNVRLGQLKKFGTNLTALAKRGLNKDLLQQIITAGPEQGAAYAQALVDATPAELKNINATQTAISKATTAFGKGAANAMYDTGTQAGKGFLTGLQSTQKLIEQQMAKLAKAIQKTIKVELKIKSPSRILEALGRFTGLGYARGVERTIPATQAAAARMAGAVRRTAAATATRIQQQSTINNGGDRHLHFNATTREVPTRKALLDALAIDDMLNRTVVV